MRHNTPQSVMRSRNTIRPQAQGTCFLARIAAMLLLAAGIQADAPPNPGRRFQLSLDDVVQYVLTNNPIVQAARLSPLRGTYDLEGAKAIYDLALHANVSYDQDKSENLSIVFGDENITTAGALGFAKYFSTGTNLSVDLVTYRRETDTPFARFDPSYETSLEISLRQPLLRNFSGLTDRLRIRITQVEISRLDLQAQNQIEKEVFQALIAYWEWIASREYTRLTEAELQTAVKFLETSEEKHKLGTAEKTDLLASQSRVKLRQLQLAQKRFEEQKAKRKLMEHIHQDAEMPWIPVEPLRYPETLPDTHTLLRRALSERRDIRMAQMRMEQAQLSLQMHRANRLPDLDMIGLVSGNGIRDEFSNTLADSTSFGNPRFLVGLEFRYFLESRKAGSAYRKALLDLEESKLRMQEVRLRIHRLVRDAIDNLNWQIHRARTLRTLKQMEDDKLASEAQQYQLGRSSSDFMLRYQDDYLRAASEHANALFGLQRALLEIQHVENTLLGNLINDHASM